MMIQKKMNDNKKNVQLELFTIELPVVHFFDKNGALRSGHLIRWIKKGKKKGHAIVRDLNGKIHKPDKIRNIEQKVVSRQ